MIRTAPDPVGLPAPGGPYSHLARIGTLVHTAGQGPAFPDGSLPEGIEAQTRQCLTNLMTALGLAGLTESDVLRVGVYLTRTEAFAAMNAVYAEFFATPAPARTTVYVGLPHGLLVEIDALGVAPRGAS